ncbi:hypothetical protein I3843_14G076300 [Carya illinoinensis]|uniref:Uncharacterized protein n=1 Tax=Carya illinoinensis TaxID=32201 RepID=A0A922AGB1_CARIL|nr:hypothetical protein I3842_14G078000 [Carya illinoinensis]KAG7947088.1 hypothetical protein I3843_14G076300 [Carya illinoinensis]
MVTSLQFFEKKQMALTFFLASLGLFLFQLLKSTFTDSVFSLVGFEENGNSCRECVPYQIRSMVDYSQHEITYGQCLDSLQNLEYLNLNGCQKISNVGIEAITNVCPTLKVFSMY